MRSTGRARVRITVEERDGLHEFVTTWRVEAPIDRVYDAIEDTL